MTPTSDSAATTSKSLWRLSGLTVWQLARNAFAGLRRNDAIGRASQLAFDFLFALFPLILLIVTMFGIFTSRSVQLRNDFLSYFSNFLPPGAFEGYRVDGELRTLEDLFQVSRRSPGLDGEGHLGYADQLGLAPFGSDVFTNPQGYSMWGHGYSVDSVTAGGR